MRIASRWTHVLRTATVAALLVTAASAQQTYFQATINASQEVPPNVSTATGNACVILDVAAHTVTFNIAYSGLTSNETAAHFHQGAPGVNGGVIIPLPAGNPKIGTLPTTPAQEAAFLAGNVYINIHTVNFPGGEIRGQVVASPLVPTTLYCPGDGTGTACPCANHSTVGADAGCLNSLGTGATLRTRGIASIGCDTLFLDGAGMTNSTAIYLQGSTRDPSGGLGTPTFDGLICVGTTVVRLGNTTNVAGASTYPAGTQVPISIRGANTPATTRDYQIFYRNAANFCTPGTANYSNGAELVWVP